MEKGTRVSWLFPWNLCETNGWNVQGGQLTSLDWTKVSSTR